MIFRLKEMREYRGLTRYKLSKLSGIKETTLQSLENCENPNPTFRTACKIADALEVSLDDLREKGGNKHGKQQKIPTSCGNNE